MSCTLTLQFGIEIRILFTVKSCKVVLRYCYLCLCSRCCKYSCSCPLNFHTRLLRGKHCHRSCIHQCHCSTHPRIRICSCNRNCVEVTRFWQNLENFVENFNNLKIGTNAVNFVKLFLPCVLIQSAVRRQLWVSSLHSLISSHMRP